MFSVRVMVRARVTLRVEVMVTVGVMIRGRVKTRTASLTMHTIVVQQPCSPQRSTAIAIHHTRATAMHSIALLAPY